MEVDGLELKGYGQITDVQEGVQEDIKVYAGIELAQIVINLEEDVSEDNFVYPKLGISEVVF